AGHRPHHLSERRPGDRLEAAGSGAARARLDRGARLGPVALAVVAPVDRLVGDLEGPARGRVRQIEVDRGGDVGPPGRAAPAPAGAPTAEERLEEVADRPEGVEARLVAARAQALVPVP